MRLYVEELQEALTQSIRIIDQTMLLDRVRLHLCKYLDPAGTFILSIYDSEDRELARVEQTLAQMIAQDDSMRLDANYYHGFVTFQFSRALTLRPGTYRLMLTADGYTYDEDEFIGWVKAHPDPNFEYTNGDQPATPADAAYDFELYSLQRVR